MRLDKEPDALELDSIEPGKDPDAMESDVGPEVLYHNLPVWALLSWPLLSELWGGSIGVEHAHLVLSDGIWEFFDGRGLLSTRNISINFVLPFILNSGGRLWTAGLTKIVMEVEGISEGGATYPRLVLSVRLFFLIITVLWVRIFLFYMRSHKG